LWEPYPRKGIKRQEEGAMTEDILAPASDVTHWRKMIKLHILMEDIPKQ
jgi:hypothetical protein